MTANWLSEHNHDGSNLYNEFIANNYYRIIKDAFENFYESTRESDLSDYSHLDSIEKLVSYYETHCDVWNDSRRPFSSDVASACFPKYGAFIDKAYPFF